MKKSVMFVCVVFAFFAFIAVPAFAGVYSGAIFTTTQNGGVVNANIYDAKEDVYLDGGPGQNAPALAAGLPEGDYYFQVTDPSGKTLLSEDPVLCREVHINANGVISLVYSATYITTVGKPKSIICTHNTGIDVDHAELGAITVQLMPYKNTPNNGGVYKVWLTRVEDFSGDPSLVDNGYSPGNYHGFIPRYSKTDNFKVIKGKPFIPPVIIIKKVHDLNANGIQDLGEPEITGWQVYAIDPLTVTTNAYTPAQIMAMPEGAWTIGEVVYEGWLQTNAFVDGAPVGAINEVGVIIQGASGETHEVVFLNIQLGDITACKDYDANANGVPDGTPVEGFNICLSGQTVNGAVFGPDCRLTGADGCTAWADLLPGNYTAEEIIPTGWHASSSVSQQIILNGGDQKIAQFTNYCTGYVAMHTKGFWQNQGCNIVTAADLDYLNSLAPYASGEYNTNGMDNCNGVSCPAVTTLPFDNPGELGCYIVAPNNQDAGIGLAQQLAAFILNMRTGNALNSSIIYGGEIYQDIVNSAITAWTTGVGVSYWQSLIDELNNAGLVEYIGAVPCPVVY